MVYTESYVGDTVNMHVLLVFVRRRGNLPTGRRVRLARKSNGQLESASHTVDGRVAEIEGSVGAQAMLMG